ncbi:hypothetical protein J6590_000139 [Homalodisca vitripennis]|nr:hypothetical protein J6590_000139 [Homalodisca vitripennis]
MTEQILSYSDNEIITSDLVTRKRSNHLHICIDLKGIRNLDLPVTELQPYSYAEAKVYSSGEHKVFDRQDTEIPRYAFSAPLPNFANYKRKVVLLSTHRRTELATTTY